MSDVLHVRGVRLPDEQPVELWIRDGTVTYEPQADASTVATGWIAPGLVDMHCHIGLVGTGEPELAVTETQALRTRDSGVLLARDCGVPGDTRWIDDRDDLPKVIRAGRHIARPLRYVRNFGVEVEPSGLVDAVAEQAKRSDGWVKIVGDWIDREAGDLTPLWPLAALTAAVAAAHENGVRATTHVFSWDGLAAALAAGFDCIEHGTGMDSDLIEAMAASGTALVPTLLNVEENFPGIAAGGEAKYPAYAAHMRALHDGAGERIAQAYEAGVPIFVGSDAGGVIEHGRIVDEIAALHRAGIPLEYVLGGASWRARNYLGRPNLDEGDPADLIVFDADPRGDLAVIGNPTRIILRGRVIA
ncbi:MAG: amidohydrolase family protein [Sporichthyaceae bacterium]